MNNAIQTTKTVSRIAALIALTAVALGAATSVQAAGSLAGTVNSTMTLQSGCIVSGAPNAGSTGVNLGTLNFGTQPSTFTGVLTANATGGVGGAGATQIVCSPDVTSISVSVSGGNNAGQGASIGTGARAMKYNTSYVPYEVYSDSGMTSAYPTTGATVGVTIPSAGTAFPLPVYGKVNKTSSAAMASGTYTDVLQVTLSW